MKSLDANMIGVTSVLVIRDYDLSLGRESAASEQVPSTRLALRELPDLQLGAQTVHRGTRKGAINLPALLTTA